jgi:hypothetical protein
MIDYNKELVSALNTVLPTHYELALKSGMETPCISYQERNNYAAETGDTLGYSRVVYTVKVWGSVLEYDKIQKHTLEIDDVLRPLGFKRTSCNELFNAQSTMLQKILTYEAMALEEFN